MDEKKIDETRLDQRCSDAGHWHFAFFDSARAVRSRTGRSGKPSALILTWWREKHNRCTCAFEIALLRSWTNEYIHWKKYSLTVFISVWFWISKNRFLEHRFILMWIFWLVRLLTPSFEMILSLRAYGEILAICILFRMTRWQRRFINVSDTGSCLW